MHDFGKRTDGCFPNPNARNRRHICQIAQGSPSLSHLWSSLIHDSSNADWLPSLISQRIGPIVLRSPKHISGVRIIRLGPVLDEVIGHSTRPMQKNKTAKARNARARSVQEQGPLQSHELGPNGHRTTLPPLPRAYRCKHGNTCTALGDQSAPDPGTAASLPSVRTTFAHTSTRKPSHTLTGERVHRG